MWTFLPLVRARRYADTVFTQRLLPHDGLRASAVYRQFRPSATDALEHCSETAQQIELRVFAKQDHSTSILIRKRSVL